MTINTGTSTISPDEANADEPQRFGPLTRLAIWIGSATSAGVAVSVLVHLVLAALAATIVVGGGGVGGGGNRLIASGEGGGIVAETTLTSLSASELAIADAAASNLPTIETPSVDLDALAGGSGLAIDLSSGAPAALSGISGAGLGGGSGAGDGASDGFGDLSAGGGGGGGSRFFGVEARGSRFVYVVDVSGSMQGDRLTALKRELTNSIDGLVGASSFLIVLFNSDAVPLGGRSRWVDASEPNKRRTFEMISKIVAGGGTYPAPAFDIAFALKPRPDAIYFMTDGLFDPAVADQVVRLNRATDRPVPIHCIAFVSREAETLMRDIARASGGTYVYVPGP
ncbi:MAG: hypothetical protein KF684_01180 [Phycisphaeraceae bacterium]|nr:hypothetical protein [Phycisphaeraceae bacterium]